MEAYTRYTAFDPTSTGQQAAISMAFIGQSSPDIKEKPQHLELLQDYTLQDFVKETAKVRERQRKRSKRDKRRRQKRKRARVLVNSKNI